MTTTPAPTFSVSPLTGTALGPFPTGWTYVAADDVHAYLAFDGVGQPVLSPVTDYTLTGATPQIDGGTVNLSPDLLPEGGWAAGATLVLFRRTVKRQALALPDTEGHKPRSTEKALDRAMLIDEEQADDLARGLAVPHGEDGITLLPAVQRDGFLPQFADGGLTKFSEPEKVVTTDADGRVIGLSVINLMQTIGVDIIDDGQWSPDDNPSLNDDGVWG